MIQTPESGSARRGRAEEGVSQEPKRQEGSQGIQTPDSGYVRTGVSQEPKGGEGVKGSRLQSLDLSEEGVSQEPKRGEEKG